MTLMERVATLLHADLELLIARSAAPEQALRQVMIDMQNQLMQVKTQLAIALAGRRRLEQSSRESAPAGAGRRRDARPGRKASAARAVRAPLQRGTRSRPSAAALRRQLAELDRHVAGLRSLLDRLQQRLAETGERLAALRVSRRSVRARGKRGSPRPAPPPVPQLPPAAEARPAAGRKRRVREAELDRLLQELSERRGDLF
jgi:phage shock protein A